MKFFYKKNGDYTMVTRFLLFLGNLLDRMFEGS